VTFPPVSIATEGLKIKRGIDGIRDYSQYFRAVTGETVSRDDFLAVANRIETLIRMFDKREWFTREDDTLPYRTLHEPLLDGPAKGQCIGEANLHRMISEYYELRGWDASGIPREETLKRYQL
jgi:aldehyde:ferredoxin oxidoreductase